MSHSSTARLRARRVVVAAILAVLALAGASVGLSLARNAAPTGETPSNLFTGAYQASRPLTDLRIGQTKFTTFGEPEPAPKQMVPLARTRSGALCLTRDARVWDAPGERVGDYASVNIAITRTGVSTFTVITNAEMFGVIVRDTINTPLPSTCLDGVSVTLTDAPKARKVLGLVEDMTPGMSGYLPAKSIWIAYEGDRYGYVLASVTRSTAFDGAVHVTKRPDGYLRVDGPKNGFTVVGMAQIQSMDSMAPFQVAFIP